MKTRRTTILGLSAAILLPSLALGAVPDWSPALEEGKVHFNARLRYEDADNAALAASQALTIRTRLGYETGAIEGISLFVELEDIRQLNDGEKANLAGQNATDVPRVPIADPEETELNRLWLQGKNENGTFKIGRQRIVYDNSRFIGNVGWRQNEQTFDAARLVFQREDEPWTLEYVYVDKIQRIFGDDAPGGADFDSDSHLLRGTYRVDARLNLVGFAYLQQLETKTGAAFNGSNDTFGLSATGTLPIDESWKFSYALTYARQSDNGGNPVGSEFDLNYLSLFGKVTQGPASIGLGWEHLEGTGTRMFTTPLATVHAFNGWADMFLGASIGGGLETGLNDAYIDGSYKVPVGKGLLLRAVYHWFSAENGSGDYGTELDLLAVYPINKQFKATAKYADFSSDTLSLPDTQKLWLQVDYAY